MAQSAIMLHQIDRKLLQQDRKLFPLFDDYLQRYDGDVLDYRKYWAISHYQTFVGYIATGQYEAAKVLGDAAVARGIGSILGVGPFEILPQYRNKGYGAEVLNVLQQCIPLTIVLYAASADSERFYIRNGFAKLDNNMLIRTVQQ